MSNGLEMIGIDTSRHSAFVIKLTVGRNWPDKGDIGHAVRKLGAIAHANLPIALIIEGLKPKPAARRVIDLNPLTDTLL